MCPMCGSRTEVSEKRGPFRDRRCTNPACRLDFTTREHVMAPREERRKCARTRATEINKAAHSFPGAPLDAQSGPSRAPAVPQGLCSEQAGANRAERPFEAEAAA
jgi:hypothetical protein